MNKLILILLITLSYSADWWRMESNPDGKLYTLRIYTRLFSQRISEYDKDYFKNTISHPEDITENRILGYGIGDAKGHNNLYTSLSMPISNNFTLGYSQSKNNSEMGEHINRTLNITGYLPLYKLWE